MADSNKTEKPTPRRREKAREEGQVARSRDLSGVAAMIAVGTILVWQAPQQVARWGTLFRRTLEIGSAQQLEPGGPVLFWTAAELARWLAAPLTAGVLVSALTGIAQGGFVLSPAALVPKPERLSPATKIKQILSITTVAGFLKSTIPFFAIAYIAISILQQRWTELAASSALTLNGFINLLWSSSFSFAWRASLVLLVWSCVDYFLTWLKFEGDLKMSKEEIRQEYKETEGNPTIKGQIRRLQRSFRRKEMISATKEATVVVTNPTHFAVALRYDLDMEVPLVVAKGQDLLAQEIKQAAYDAGVPVLENRPLARALFRTTEVGSVIPSKLYTAVAEVLAFVYRTQQKAKQRFDA